MLTQAVGRAICHIPDVQPALAGYQHALQLDSTHAAAQRHWATLASSTGSTEQHISTRANFVLQQRAQQQPTSCVVRLLLAENELQAGCAVRALGWADEAAALWEDHKAETEEYSIEDFDRRIVCCRCVI